MSFDYETDRRRPYVPGDYRYVRAGPDGTYWQEQDGMVVRLAAPEPGPAVERNAAIAAYESIVAQTRLAWQR